jgi:hypothetical protein
MRRRADREAAEGNWFLSFLLNTMHALLVEAAETYVRAANKNFGLDSTSSFFRVVSGIHSNSQPGSALSAPAEESNQCPEFLRVGRGGEGEKVRLNRQSKDGIRGCWTPDAQAGRYFAKYQRFVRQPYDTAASYS